MKPGPPTRAVILARGLGTRMRQSDVPADLTRSQEEVAATGVKALIPVGRPFVDYQLNALADAGFREVCLVVGPGSGEVQRHCMALRTGRLTLGFATQLEPRGTADAVLAAQGFANGRHFLVINSDNYYPTASLQAAHHFQGPGLIAFSARSLIENSGIPAERVGTFPVVEEDAGGFLFRLGEGQLNPLERYVSMNCWVFDSSIFTACRGISPSSRGELELPDAVRYSMEHLGTSYRVHRSRDSVYDLSTRADIQRVTGQLRGTVVTL